MPATIDEGLCIRQWDWSETSQTAAIFCRALGLVRVLAKGSKRPKHPYSGGLEMLTRGRMGVIVRPSSELALLTEWDLVQSFPALRASLGVHQAGLYIADLIQHVIHDHDPHTALYDATIECLGVLRGPEDVGLALLKFQWSALVETGYKPELAADIRTGEALGEAAAYGFSPALGGFHSDTARERSGGGEGGASTHSSGIWRVRRGTLELLRGVDAAGLSGLTDGVDADAVERANRLLASYLRHVLGAEPPTMAVVFGSRLSR